MEPRRASRPVGGALVGFTDGAALIDPVASPRRSRLVPRALGWLLAALLRLLAATWRSDTTTRARLAIEGDTPRLLGFWHGKYFALLALLRGIDGSVLIAPGFRGEVIAAICEQLGFTPILLPRGDREQAIEQVGAALRSHALCATALDGPLGPARRVKRSLLRVAAEIGAEIVPASVVSSPNLVLGWRWDRREIPLPLSRVRLRVGEPVAIPKGTADDALDEWRSRLARRLDELEHPQANAALVNEPCDTIDA